MQIQTCFAGGQLLPCTEKCLANYYEGLLDCLNQDKNNCLSAKDYNLFLLAEKLLRMPVCKNDKTNSTVIRNGSGAELVIDKKILKLVFLDGASVIKNDFLPFNQDIVTISSPIGSAILNKKKNEKGKFKLSGKLHDFQILKVFPYEETKRLFFPKIAI